jgi:uncharacterized protein (DUF58 family)
MNKVLFEPVSGPLRVAPQNRLLFWIGMVLLPFAGLAGTVPSTVPLAVVASGLLAVLVATDAALSLSRLRGISVALPETVRVSKDREGTIDITIQSDSESRRRLRIGLAFPAEIESPQDDVTTVLTGQGVFRVPWPCTARKRGVFCLEKVYVEQASKMGFWAIRQSAPTRAEVRVYPNLLGERRQVAAVFLNRGGFGIHAQRQVGKGREFEKLRDYMPGDSYDEIHWKATAKRGHPVTKMFQIERTQEVYVVVDASRLSARPVPVPQEALAEVGPAVVPQLERFITSSLVLGLAAERQGDLFGLLTFSDRVHRFVRARNGKAHYSACRDAIYTLEPSLVNPDFDELCMFIRLRLRRRALLVFLTNLDDPVLAEGFLGNIELLSRQHLILVNMLAPEGVRPLFPRQPAPDENMPGSVDDLYGRLCGHIQWHGLRELDRALHHRGVSFSLARNESLAAELVTQYVNVKQRQLL